MINLFTILIASFLISNYSKNKNLSEDLKYEKNYGFKASYILSIVIWAALILSYGIHNLILKIVSLILLAIIVLKEIIVSLIKLNFYNKQYKEREIRNSKMKHIMIIDAMKNIFYVLSSPLLIIQTGLNWVLNKIF